MQLQLKEKCYLKKKTGFKLWFVVLKQYGHECLIVIMFSTPKLSFDLTYF